MRQPGLREKRRKGHREAALVANRGRHRPAMKPGAHGAGLRFPQRCFLLGENPRSLCLCRVWIFQGGEGKGPKVPGSPADELVEGRA